MGCAQQLAQILCETAWRDAVGQLAHRAANSVRDIESLGILVGGRADDELKARLSVARPPRPSRTKPAPCSLRPCPSRALARRGRASRSPASSTAAWPGPDPSGGRPLFLDGMPLARGLRPATCRDSGCRRHGVIAAGQLPPRAATRVRNDEPLGILVGAKADHELNARLSVARPPRPSRTKPAPCSLRPCPSLAWSAARRSPHDNTLAHFAPPVSQGGAPPRVIAEEQSLQPARGALHPARRTARRLCRLPSAGRARIAETRRVSSWLRLSAKEGRSASAACYAAGAADRQPDSCLVRLPPQRAAAGWVSDRALVEARRSCGKSLVMAPRRTRAPRRAWAAARPCPSRTFARRDRALRSRASSTAAWPDLEPSGGRPLFLDGMPLARGLRPATCTRFSGADSMAVIAARPMAASSSDSRPRRRASWNLGRSKRRPRAQRTTLGSTAAAPLEDEARTLLAAPLRVPGVRSPGPRVAQPSFLDRCVSRPRTKRRPSPVPRRDAAGSWAAASNVHEISHAESMAWSLLANWPPRAAARVRHHEPLGILVGASADHELEARLSAARPPRPSRTKPAPCSLRPCPSRAWSAARRSPHDNTLAHFAPPVSQGGAPPQSDCRGTKPSACSRRPSSRRITALRLYRRPSAAVRESRRSDEPRRGSDCRRRGAGRYQPLVMPPALNLAPRPLVLAAFAPARSRCEDSDPGARRGTAFSRQRRRVAPGRSRGLRRFWAAARPCRTRAIARWGRAPRSPSVLDGRASRCGFQAAAASWS